jgi:hypothetical protein
MGEESQRSLLRARVMGRMGKMMGNQQMAGKPQMGRMGKFQMGRPLTSVCPRSL